MLGFLSLGLLYLFIGIGCLVATSIMNKIGLKKSMMLGSICDCLQILFCMFPALKQEIIDSQKEKLSDNGQYSHS
jgi:hypothetical protein